ncbi:hypothetical protein TNCT_213491 [Trichonephila clavata]|uniref:Uncharacterized protein n=1 Tax=Trichonephila clavata TaxID=2740835 RepID=A0A8X6HL05_TRICU|nr:hypothetical protein TNCT_213491 [Trichonephila clavata]
MRDTGRRQLTRNVNVKERVLQFFEDNLITSTQDIAQKLGVYESAVWWIVHERGMHPVQKGVGAPVFNLLSFLQTKRYSVKKVGSLHKIDMFWLTTILMVREVTLRTHTTSFCHKYLGCNH